MIARLRTRIPAWAALITAEALIGFAATWAFLLIASPK